MENVLMNYNRFLEEKIKNSCPANGPSEGKQPSSKLSVGIVGAGIAGLYSALTLQNYNSDVKIKVFEANNRVGGRIFTHKFSSEPGQICEAGATKVPYSSLHISFFRLIEYLNKKVPNHPIKLIDCVVSYPSGNRVLINGTKQKDGRVMSADYASRHSSELGFPNVKDSDEPGSLLRKALEPIVADLKNDLESAVSKYSQMSLYQYLLNEVGWTEEKIYYVEVTTLNTNASHAGVLYTVLYRLPLLEQKYSWKTIDGGMAQLPKLCAKVVQMNGGDVLTCRKVESIRYHGNNPTGLVELGYVDKNNPSKDLVYETFDAVILAIPPSCIKIMPVRPQWPANMEYALCALRHCPLRKMSLRFKSHFWERTDLQHPPSYGGMSVTDLPSQYILYPSHDIGGNGMGILTTYSRSNESLHWLSLTDQDKIKLVLRDLQLLYPEVDVASEYAGGTDCTSSNFTKECFIVDWVKEWSVGVCGLSFPGQFVSLFPILAQPRGNIFFAGDHLGTLVKVFIAGALESAQRAVQQVILKHSIARKDKEVNGIKLETTFSN